MKPREDVIWLRRDLLRTMADALAAEGLQYVHCPEWETCGNFTVLPATDSWKCPKHGREGVAP